MAAGIYADTLRRAPKPQAHYERIQFPQSRAGRAVFIRSDISIREEDKKFIIDFYKYAFVGFMIDWIKKGMKEQPEAFIEKLSVLIKGDIKRALDRFRTDK